jgi:putative RNA 2'-phosphotransferase
MKNLVSTSKSIATWLRHRPETIGLQLDKQGWTPISELLAKAAAKGFVITHEELMQVVAENDKKRFSISEDGLRIRAAQGHSVPVELDLPIKKPPPVLYHGTVPRFIESIRKQGLLPGNRHDVHMSANTETATSVGSRRGAAVILKIETFPMVRDGYVFRCSDNGVWLTSAVPAKYIKFPN